MKNILCRLLFNARGKLGVIDFFDRQNNPETRVWYPMLDAPSEVSNIDHWGWGPIFRDRRRAIVSGYESGPAWEGRIWVHHWVYDLEEDRMIEPIVQKNRPAPFMVCNHLLPDEDQLMTGPVIDGKQRIWIMDLDGANAREITGDRDGFVYGAHLSPDGRQLAYHATMLAHRDSYCIYVSDLNGDNKKEIAAAQGHLYFGPVWSPDKQWLIYQDCHYPDDPGHDWADICLGSPDGRRHQKVTTGQLQWFATSYGDPETRGGGSNMAQWTPDGKRVTYTRAEPGSRTAWQYQANRPDTDHFNRDYLPKQAWGGSAICLLDPFSGNEQDFIPYEPLVWNFRAAWSPDMAMMAFCRAEVGEPGALWIINGDGSGLRKLTDGYNHHGADHPVWVTYVNQP